MGEKQDARQKVDPASGSGLALCFLAQSPREELNHTLLKYRRSWSATPYLPHVGLKSPETVTPVELSSLKLLPSGVTDEGASEMEVMETEFVRDRGRSGRKHREQGKRKE